jgi:hypothetical protein
VAVAALLGTMVLIFGAIPFTDAVIVRYVDDRLRSRVAGMRLTVLGFSSLAVWLLGPVVKAGACVRPDTCRRRCRDPVLRRADGNLFGHALRHPGRAAITMNAEVRLGVTRSG